MLGAVVMVGPNSRMAMRVVAGPRLVQVLKSVSDGLPHPGRWAIRWLEGRIARAG